MPRDTFDPYDPCFTPFIDLKTEQLRPEKALTMKELDQIRFAAKRRYDAAKRREDAMTDVELAEDRARLDEAINQMCAERGLGPSANTRSRWETPNHPKN